MNKFEPIKDFVTPIQQERKEDLEKWAENFDEHCKREGIERNEISGLLPPTGLIHALKFKYDKGNEQ